MFLSVPVATTLAGGATALALGGWLRWRREVAQTTLVPAWWWAVVATIAWGGVELASAIGWPDAGWLVPLRFAAVSLSFCPVMAILGAKRPQHAAWSFVVASLWGILALPAAETFFLQRGQRLEINAFRGWFLWLLIALGPINFLPTSRWPAALLLAAAQVLGLAEHLPLVGGPWFAGQSLVAGLVAGLVPWANVGHSLREWPGKRNNVNPRTGDSRSESPKLALDRLWIDFRNAFGLLWSLRLQERVNAVAFTNHWPIVLTWTGLCDSRTGETLATIDPAIEPILRTTMKGLLRRFVSGRWIAERSGQDID